jgi:cytochrome c oxidase subunit 2
VVHKTKEDLEAWIKKYSSRGDISMEEWGKRLYQQRGCQGCHSVDGSQRTGPTYKDAFGSTRELVSGETVPIDENYVRESILYPKAKVSKGYNPVMPSYKGQLSDDDIGSLIAFLKTVSKNVKEEKAEPAKTSAPTTETPDDAKDTPQTELSEEELTL